MPGRRIALSGLLSVDAGEHHSLAVLKSGECLAWGSNHHGQLGGSTAADRTSPVTIQLPGRAAKVAAGTDHSAAVLENGECWTWGRAGGCEHCHAGQVRFNRATRALESRSGDHGWLGHGAAAGQPAPVALVGRVQALASHFRHSLVVLEGGEVWAWGCNRHGQLGDGTRESRERPVRVPLAGRAAAVAAGDTHSLTVLEGGECWAWGRNCCGELGDSTTAHRTNPVQVPLAGRVVAVAAGRGHSLAILESGECWAWGRNSHGQLGDGTTADQSIPVRVPLAGHAVSVAAGPAHSFAVLDNGECWAWGHNSHGQLGDSTIWCNLLHPSQVLVPDRVAAVGAGASHSLVMLEGDECWALGCNCSGELGDGAIWLARPLAEGEPEEEVPEAPSCSLAPPPAKDPGPPRARAGSHAARRGPAPRSLAAWTAGRVLGSAISIAVALHVMASTSQDPPTGVAADAGQLVVGSARQLPALATGTNSWAHRGEAGHCDCDVASTKRSIWCTANATWVAIVSGVAGIVWYWKTNAIAKERKKLKQMAVEVAMEYVQNQCKLAQVAGGGSIVERRANTAGDGPGRLPGRLSIGGRPLAKTPPSIFLSGWDVWIPD